jgi:hypothetical protein
MADGASCYATDHAKFFVMKKLLENINPRRAPSMAHGGLLMGQKTLNILYK